MKRIAALGGAALALLVFGLVSAAAITTALNRTDIVITNNSGGPAADLGLSFNLSTVNMIDGSFINADCLDCAVQQSDETIGFMPGSDRVRVLAAFNNAAGDETTAANNPATNDLTLPATGSEVYEFAFDHQARVLRLHVSTPVVASAYTVAWEYYNGVSYAALPSVTDHSESFSVPGESDVFWDFPAAGLWPASTLHSVEGYWIRANVSATGVTTPPLGERAYFETGRWWVWEASIPDNDSRIYNLYTGGPDHVESHQWFPGADGATTADAASIELGSTYVVEVQGRLNPTHPTTGSGSGSACLACKEGAFELYWSATDALTLDVTGSGGQSLTITPITLPATGSQTITIASNGADLTFTVDGIGLKTGTAETILDNANPWVWADEASMVYVDRLGIGDADFETITGSASFTAGTLTSTEAFTGPRDETSLLPGRQFQPNQESHTGSWLETGSGFQTTSPIICVAAAACSMRMGLDSALGVYNAFALFESVTIGQGETVSYAEVRTAIQVEQDATKVLTISAVESDDAAAPTNFTEAETATRTAATVASSTNQGTTTTLTVEITAIIQEIVDRPGWASGNDIVIYWEDNGSAGDSNYLMSDIDDNAEMTSLPTLEIWLLEDTSAGFVDDWVQALRQANPNGWAESGTAAGSSAVQAGAEVDYAAEFLQPHHGGQLYVVDAAASPGATTLSQNTAATPGQMWSVSVASGIPVGSTDNQWDATLFLTWLDASLSTISEVSSALPEAPALNLFPYTAIDGETAPALTAWLQFRIEWTCTTSCNQDGWGIDDAMACICATALAFPNPSNQLINPGFEEVYSGDPATWESAAFILNATSVSDTWVVWDGDLPGQDDTTGLLVEGSLNGSTWTAVASGDDFPGVSSGDDITAQNLFLRATFTAANNLRSGFISTIQVGVIDANDNLLLYEPILPIGFALTDLTAFGNDTATLTLPVTLGDFAALIQSTAPTVPTTPGGGGVDPVDILPDIEIIANVTGDATAADGSGLVWFQLFDFAADNTGFPKQAMLFGFALTVTLMAVFGAWLWSKNMWIAWGSLVFFLAVFSYGIPILPIWVLFLGGIFGLLFPITATKSAVV